MRRIGMLLVALGLVAAACGGGGTAAPGGESGDGGGVTTLSPLDDPSAVEGTPAPDFTLALSDGSEFVLSSEEKPVYLVFWAEW